MLHSIIIPTFNGERNLAAVVKSLIQQNYPGSEFEILIVDNASTDKTNELSLQLKHEYHENIIRYIYEPIPGLLSGRHRGAVEAKADILSFIDDDIIADKEWLSSISESFSNSSVQIVGGKNLPKYEIEPPKWIEDLWRDSPYGGKWLGYLSVLDFGDEKKDISPLYVWGLNFSIRKDTLLKSGGFNPDTYPKYLQKYQGDGETGLSLKLQKMNLVAEYQPKALVHHIIPETRLTLDFFKKRSYFQGVSDSYTYIRKYVKNSNPKKYFERKPKSNKILSLAKTMYRKCRCLFSEKDPREIRKIKKTLNKSYQEGYSFHQNEVKKDPLLLDWISKPDYWDYSLPEKTQIERSSFSEKSY